MKPALHVQSVSASLKAGEEESGSQTLQGRGPKEALYSLGGHPSHGCRSAASPVYPGGHRHCVAEVEAAGDTANVVQLRHWELPCLCCNNAKELRNKQRQATAAVTSCDIKSLLQYSGVVVK